MTKDRSMARSAFVIILGIFLAFTTLLALEGVRSHSPSSVVLEYYPGNATLKVTITHNTPTPNYHYIKTVEIMKNGELDSTYDYSDQPSTGTFTYEYMVQAMNGDILSARAVCNIAGELTAEITVAGPVLPLRLEISPQISSVDEGSDRDFTINAYSGSDPVDGVEMALSMALGTASEVESLGIGGYQFTYKAPSVDSDSDETLTVTGSKNGYEDATVEISFTIVDVDSSDKVRIEFVDPPKNVVEGEETSFLVRLRSGTDPVTGADVEASATNGDVGPASEGDPGDYSFTYTPPDIASDTKVTITVTASSPPLEDGTGSIQITVKAAKRPLDGIISGGEYSHSTDLASGDLEVHWTVGTSELSMALKGRTAGWIAIGFGATSFMKDADMIIGYVDSSKKATVLDCHSTGNYGPHPPDAQLGGADNLIATGGSESGGWTIIEFTRRLDSPDDRFDNDIDPAKRADLIWAMGKEDDPLSQHDGADIDRGTYLMDWSKSGGAGGGKGASAATMWLGALGILFLVSGIVAISTRKKGALGDPLRKAGMGENGMLYLGIGSIIVASVLFVLAILMME